MESKNQRIDYRKNSDINRVVVVLILLGVKVMQGVIPQHGAGKQIYIFICCGCLTAMGWRSKVNIIAAHYGE